MHISLREKISLGVVWEIALVFRLTFALVVMSKIDVLVHFFPRRTETVFVFFTCTNHSTAVSKAHISTPNVYIVFTYGTYVRAQNVQKHIAYLLALITPKSSIQCLRIVFA